MIGNTVPVLGDKVLLRINFQQTTARNPLNLGQSHANLLFI